MNHVVSPWRRTEPPPRTLRVPTLRWSRQHPANARRRRRGLRRLTLLVLLIAALAYWFGWAP